MKILVIEDDNSTCELLRMLLEQEENHELVFANTGEKGMEELLINLPDLIILDINLPDKNGFDICDTIRKKPEVFGTPLILMLTSEIEQKNVIYGFEKGADDYIKKPFDFNELILRVRSLGKRQLLKETKWYKYETITIDFENFNVYENDKLIRVNRKECELLVYFTKNRGIVISREKILQEVWETEYTYGNRTVDMAVSRLKKKIGILENRLETVSGIGYKLVK